MTRVKTIWARTFAPRLESLTYDLWVELLKCMTYPDLQPSTVWKLVDCTCFESLSASSSWAQLNTQTPDVHYSASSTANSRVAPQTWVLENCHGRITHPGQCARVYSKQKEWLMGTNFNLWISTAPIKISACERAVHRCSDKNNPNKKGTVSSLGENKEEI